MDFNYKMKPAIIKNIGLTFLAILFSVISFAALPPITGTTSICLGASTTLSDATPGGTWYSGDVSVAVIGSSSGFVSSVSVGTSIITYTDGVSSVYATVTVNAVPAPITGVPAICGSGTTTLGDVTPGGIWISSNPSVASVGVTTGLVTGNSPGTTLISYTIPSGCSSVVTVTVSPIPVLSGGGSTVCVGSSIAIGGTPAGGTWTSSTTNATVSASGLVTGAAVGTAGITYTMASGCYASRAMTVNPAIGAITGTPTVCVSFATTLGHPVAGGNWSTSNAAVATISSTTGITTGNTVGTATISYVVAGCLATTVMSVNGVPTGITGPSSVCVGSTITWVGIGGVSATWTSSATSVATVSSAGIVSGMGVGTSTITYNTGCGSTTRVVSVNSSCTGTPVPGPITASTSVVCSGTSFVLNLPSYTPVCGQSIQWQYSPDGTSWSNLPGAVTVPYTYTPTAAYYYRCGITCVSSGLTGFSGPVHVIVDFSIGVHSVIAAPSTTCPASHFYVAACGVSSAFSVLTFFGDGDSALTALSTTTLSDAHIYHTYGLPGTYTIKHILYNGALAMDTVTFDYNYLFCRTLPIRFYNDINSNCVFDAGDAEGLVPVTTRVDSNGVPVDTIIVTSGFAYQALGGPGTIYAFRPITVGGSLVLTCPASGVIYDTINTYTNTYVTKYFGIRCSPSGGFDLKVDATVLAGRHSQRVDMVVTNFYCYAVSPVVTFTFSPKYGYFPGTSPCYFTYPAPTSVVGNVMTWSLASLSANATRTISVYLERPSSIGPWLVPGDTVNSTISVTPTVGDIIPSNNVITRVDTVKVSYDPNDLAVKPEGYILPCTQLQYKVRFENTGNDTAHNIYVLDTLSAELDPASISAVVASHSMNIAVINDGTHTIAKFEFPNINLLDSSHHALCSGMFVFGIKAKSTLTDGTQIMNRVGIFFDDNPAVMTNEVTNTGGIPPITGPGNVCIGYPATYLNTMPGGAWVSSVPAVGTITGGGVVSGLTTGTSLISYTVFNSCASRTATKEVTVNPVVVPSAAIIATPGDTVCAGTSVSYTSVIAFGGAAPAYVWQVNGTSVSTSSSYTFTPVAGDTVTLAMASSQACAMPGIVGDTMPMEVVAMATPVASVAINPGDTSCAGTPVTYTATPSFGGDAPGYTWFVNGSATGSGPVYIYTPTNGDVLYCRMGSNFMCRLADTVNSGTIHMTVDPLYIPDISISASPSFAAVAGDPITLTATVANAGPTPVYQWVINSFPVPGANTNVFTSSTFSDYDSVTCIVTGSGICHITAYNSVFVTIWGVGVRNISAGHDIHVSPNPNKGSFSIRGSIGTMKGREVAVTVNNMLGQVVYSGNTTIGNDGTINEFVQLPDMLPNGVYMLNFRADNESSMFRFVIDK